MVFLPDGLAAKGGKKIPLAASLFDHKDISEGEDSDHNNDETFILQKCSVIYQS